MVNVIKNNGNGGSVALVIPQNMTGRKLQAWKLKNAVKLEAAKQSIELGEIISVSIPEESSDKLEPE
jgi:hypothetical protein